MLQLSLIQDNQFLRFLMNESDIDCDIANIDNWFDSLIENWKNNFKDRDKILFFATNKNYSTHEDTLKKIIDLAIREKE